MRWVSPLSALFAILVAIAPVHAAGRIGLVLMHGKTGMPTQLAKLAAALKASGYIVESPEMCWSKTRIFDRPLADCMAEIEKAVGDLKAQGATKIVVTGMSQGGAVALYYGATHSELAGIVALAPAADPVDPSPYPDFIRSRKTAQQMAEAGQGQTVSDFFDVVNGKTVPIRASPNSFLSFHGLDSPIVTIKAMMTTVLPKLTIPLLWVSGTRDNGQRIADKAFATVPGNHLDRHETVDADHVETPDASIAVVEDWLKTLQ
ncbi:alpha/beta hydrolase [Hypericibacter sp.]|uniref:alpha/beta hydrolase n=1 Tax=Hypericibacter sp. TaxID=2705401 RepID=UPI003D6CA23D